MSFDWMSFATGFLEQTYSTIEENRKKASDYEDKLRENAERNKAKIQDVKALKDVATSKYKQLMSKGIPETTIRAALASGPTGISDLEKAWSDAERKYGAEIIKANPDLYAAASITPEDAMLTGEGALSSDEFISRTLGLSAPTTGSVEAPRGNFLDILFNRNAKARVRAAMDKEVAAMGYSIYDLNEAANTAGYKSILPGAYVEYKSPNIFTPSQAADEAINLQRTLEQNDAYSEARKALAKAEEELAGAKVLFNANNLSEKKYEEYQTAVATARERVSTVARTALGGILTTQAGIYQGDSYLKTLAPALDGLVGIPGFTSGFMTGETEPVATDTAPPTAVVPQAATKVEAPKAETPLGENIVVAEEIATYKSENILSGVPVTVVKGEDGKDYIRLEQGIIEKGTGQPVPKGYIIDAEQSEELIKRYKGTESVGESKRRRGGNIGMEGTAEEKDQVSPGSGGRGRSGQPPRGLGAREEQPVQGRSGPTSRPMLGQNLQDADMESRQTPVDEMSDALLRQSANDMVKFARDKGLTKDSRPEEVLVALTEWADANKKMLPMDKGSLIYAIKYGLGLRK